MNPRWLLRAKRWAQNPPSMNRIMLAFGVIGFCVLIYLIERVFGWPSWLTPNDMRRPLGAVMTQF
jgi:hypothetical protein